MGDDLDVFFQYDITSIVKSAVLSIVLASVANGASNIEFVQGALVCAQVVCVGIGAKWEDVLADLRSQARVGGWIGLLEAAQSQMLHN